MLVEINPGKKGAAVLDDFILKYVISYQLRERSLGMRSIQLKLIQTSVTIVKMKNELFLFFVKFIDLSTKIF